MTLDIVHLNVRYARGGAARIQQDLHERLIATGHVSRIGYGYGPRGGKDPDAVALTNVVQLSTPLRAATNLLVHRVMGSDVIPPLGRRWSSLVTEGTVIHAHAIHSHFMPLEWLARQVLLTRNPVLITAHDDWLFTGRCAIAGNCERWRKGCGQCPDRSRYPAALIDRSDTMSRRRRELIRRVAKHLVVPSTKLLLQARLIYPDLPVSLIPNGLDMRFEIESQPVAASFASQPTRERPLVFLAADLSDKEKVDPILLAALNNGRVPTLLIGDKPPFQSEYIRWAGKVNDRAELFRLLSAAAALVFTSKVDSFGLVMIEALASGLPVLAVPSPAAENVLGQMGLNCVSMPDLIDFKDQLLNVGRKDYSTPLSLRSTALAQFDGSKMFESYLSKYQTLVSDMK